MTGKSIEKESKFKKIIPSKLELFVFAGGLICGITDRIANNIGLSNKGYFTGGLPMTITALLVSTGVCNNIKKGIKVATPLYAGYLCGETLIEFTYYLF